MILRVSKLTALTLFAAILGSWLGSVLVAPRLGIGWYATLFWTLPGAMMVGLIYGALRGRHPRSAQLYIVVVIVGTVTGGAMLLIFGSLWLVTLGMGFGAITSIIWVMGHWIIRDLGCQKQTQTKEQVRA